MSWLICKSYKAGRTNGEALMSRLGDGNPDVYCALDCMRAFTVADPDLCIEEKQKIFSDYMRRPSGLFKLFERDRQAVANACALFLEKLGKKAPLPGGDFSGMSLEEILQFGAEELTRADRTVFECLFSTLLLCAIGAKISSPPIRLGCRNFIPERMRAVSENFPTPMRMLEERVYGPSDRPQYLFWFALPRREEVDSLCETGDAAILFTEPGREVDDFLYAVFFWDGVCAILDPKNRLVPDLPEGGLWFGDNRFEPITEEILRRLQSMSLPNPEGLVNPQGSFSRPDGDFQTPNDDPFRDFPAFRALYQVATDDLRESAVSRSRQNSGQLAIALETDSGKIWHTLVQNGHSYNGLSAEEAALIGRMEKERDTAAVRVLCLWQGGFLDLPSFDFRKRLCALSPKNREAELLLTAECGLNVLPIWRTVGTWADTDDSDGKSDAVREKAE